MAIEKFNVSFILTREDSNDDDDTWYDEEYIASEIKTWLEDIDYGVTNLKVNNTKFIRQFDEEDGDVSSIRVDEAMKEWRKNVQNK